MIVLDASAALELLLRTEVGERVARRLETPSLTLHAPHLIDLEVAQVFRRYVRLGELTSGRAALSVEAFLALDLNRYPHEALLPRIWQLRDNFSAYDAAYVALAEVLEAPLLTADKRLLKALGTTAHLERV